MSSIDEIAHKLAEMTNDVVKLEQKAEDESDDSSRFDGQTSSAIRMLVAARVVKANLEWMKEVSRYEASELIEILQTMANQRHEYAVDFFLQRLGIQEYNIIKNHRAFAINRWW